MPNQAYSWPLNGNPQRVQTATPSPVMSNQAYPWPTSGAPHRVQTASPSPFPQPSPNYGPPMSQSPVELNGPQGQPMAGAFMTGASYGPGYSQSFTPPPGMKPAATPNAYALAPPQMAHSQQMMGQSPNMQRMYQARLQQQFQQNRLQQSGAPAGIPGSPSPVQISNIQAINNMRAPAPMARQNNSDHFLKSVGLFMHQRGLPFNPNPQIGHPPRPLSLMTMYSIVMRLGGSQKVTISGAWPGVAMNLQLPQSQFPNAPQELKEHYERNLVPYEEAWWQAQRQKTMHLGQLPPSGSGVMPPHMSPTKAPMMMGQGLQTAQYSPQPDSSFPDPSPLRPPTGPLQEAGRATPVNGYSTPPHGSSQNRSVSAQQRTATARTNGTPPQGQPPGFPSPSPGPSSKPASLGPAETSPSQYGRTSGTAQRPITQNHPNYEPRKRNLEFYAGLDVAVLGQVGEELLYHKPTAPTFMELGVIDIHALTLSLRSGIHAEVRLALDSLATLSVEPRLQLSLQSCEDLVETLVDCAEIQVEALAEHTVEVSDAMDISSYEDVVRGCRLEIETLQEIPPFGSLDYELDRSVERLICITTILRNLSFFENNHDLLADAGVVKFLATVIRYLGTRTMLLRTYLNTLDFMKDIIIYLSNLSQAIELPGKDEALSLLHFLLSFAPCPPPLTTSSDSVIFSSYQPSIHRYLPPAVDSLAKLLARDEPNRTFYRAIFHAEATSLPPFDLLTRAFALAISPIPDNGRNNLIPSVEARKPYLVQGMLAAEILANLAPGPEYGLARSWLASEDGFAVSLLRLICLLSTDRVAPPTRHPSGRMLEVDSQSYYPITHRGIHVLRRLAEKCGHLEELTGPSLLPAGVLPKREVLLGALLTQGIDADLVKQLCAYANLDH